MPIIKSAKKRVRVAEKAAIRNSKSKRSLKAALKSFVSGPKADKLSNAQSELDKAVKKGLITKNKAARKKKQLVAQAKTAGVKPAAKAKTSTKPVAKTTAKKSPTKATVKKTAARPSAKKTTKK